MKYYIKLVKEDPDPYDYDNTQIFRVISHDELNKFEDWDRDYVEGMIFEDKDMAEKFCILLNLMRNNIHKFSADIF